MRSISLILLLSISVFSFGQIHNRLVKINLGISGEQIEFKDDIKNFNDTSSHQFEFVSMSPTISYTHEFIFSNILSVSGKAGFQYLNIFYDNQHYGSSFGFLSINPALSLYYRKKFEYYIKLQVGVNYWFNKPELLPNITQRGFPEGINVFTGITIGGFNYYISNKLGLNLELSVWSPELVTFGLSYRFFRGEIPNIQELQEL
mgnify:CR=1 FL=1